MYAMCFGYGVVADYLQKHNKELTKNDNQGTVHVFFLFFKIFSKMMLGTTRDQQREEEKQLK